MEENEKITEQNTDVSVEDMPESSLDIVSDTSNDNSETTSDIPQTLETTEEETTTEETTTEETTTEEEITTEEATTQEQPTQEKPTQEETFTEIPFLEKPINDYSTTEGLLFLLLVLFALATLYHIIFD